MIFANVIGAILLVSYLLQLHKTDISILSKPFADNNLSFNLYKNVIIPQIGAALLMYLSYLWVSLYTIPRLLFPRKVEGGTSKISMTLLKISFQGMAKKMLKEYSWLLMQIILIIFILGTAFDFSTYYLHQWQFNYPEFSIFFNRNDPRSQIDIYLGYAVASFLIGLYALYVIVRELIIAFIERSGSKKDFRALICNQITAFFIIYIIIYVALNGFDFVHDYAFQFVYFLAIPPMFAMFISNMYWLFPKKGDSRFFSRKIISGLLYSSFIYSVPFAFFSREGMLGYFALGCAMLLFCITPITWLLYQTQKDKILLLRGTEKALAKTKTDLQFLRSQINPHFLFNVLNTLYGTALQEKAERTASGIQKLGDMMRFMLHENNLDFIDMGKEIGYLRNYISLQKLRTQSSPDIIIEENISDQSCRHKIAPMLLIPLVENAFKHGISLKEKSWIKIDLSCTENNILFEVRNSMHIKQENDPEKERSGIGFKNVLERLKLIYPGKFQASVNGDGKEFFVQLSIQP